MSIVVYVTVGPTNRDPVALVDLARRQANYLGPEGFSTMSNQTDERFRAKGDLRMVFSTRRLADRFRQRVAENCDEAVSTRLAVKNKLKIKRAVRYGELSVTPIFAWATQCAAVIGCML